VLEPVVGVGEEGFFSKAVRRGLGVRAILARTWWHPIAPARRTAAPLSTLRLDPRRGADIVHAHTSKAGVVGRVAARAAGVPAIFTAHTWCFAEGNIVEMAIGGCTARSGLAGLLSSAIINVSEGQPGTGDAAPDFGSEAAC